MNVAALEAGAHSGCEGEQEAEVGQIWISCSAVTLMGASSLLRRVGAARVVVSSARAARRAVSLRIGDRVLIWVREKANNNIYNIAIALRNCFFFGRVKMRNVVDDTRYG